MLISSSTVLIITHSLDEILHNLISDNVRSRCAVDNANRVTYVLVNCSEGKPSLKYKVETNSRTTFLAQVHWYFVKKRASFFYKL